MLIDGQGVEVRFQKIVFSSGPSQRSDGVAGYSKEGTSRGYVPGVLCAAGVALLGATSSQSVGNFQSVTCGLMRDTVDHDGDWIDNISSFFQRCEQKVESSHGLASTVDSGHTELPSDGHHLEGRTVGVPASITSLTPLTLMVRVAVSSSPIDW